MDPEITVKPTIRNVVQYILMASYCYYELAVVLLTDGVYDEFTRYCALNWEVIEHPHKHLIRYEKGDNNVSVILKLEDYPEIVKSATKRLLKDTLNNSLTTEIKDDIILEEFRVTVNVDLADIARKNVEKKQKSLWDV